MQSVVLAQSTSPLDDPEQFRVLERVFQANQVACALYLKCLERGTRMTAAFDFTLHAHFPRLTLRAESGAAGSGSAAHSGGVAP